MPVNRQLPLAAAAGLLSASLFLSLAKGIALGALLSYVAPMPVMLAGLVLGMTASASAGAVGMVAVALVVNPVSVLPFFIAVVLPALVVANRATLGRTAPDGTVEWYPPGLILSWLTATGLVLVLAGIGLVGDHPDGARGWVTAMIGRFLDLVAADIPLMARTKAVEWWVPFFPAMVISSWLVMAVINGVLAQALALRLGRAIRPRPSYGQISLPDWMAQGLGLCGLASLSSQGNLEYAALNAGLVLGIPFLFLGLAGIHGWAKGRPNAGFILAVTYGLLILIFGWAALAVAGLGLARFLRSRFRRPDSGGMEG